MGGVNGSGKSADAFDILREELETFLIKNLFAMENFTGTFSKLSWKTSSYITIIDLSTSEQGLLVVSL